MLRQLAERLAIRRTIRDAYISKGCVQTVEADGTIRWRHPVYTTTH